MELTSCMATLVNHENVTSLKMFLPEWIQTPNYQIMSAAILIIIMASLAISELLKWKSKRCNSTDEKFKGYNTDYPEMWKYKFEQSRGKLQSPINIQTSCCLVIRGGKKHELSFSEKYFKVPKGITVLNDGFGDEYPVVKGGPLKGQYRFNLCHFKWGPTDIEGSEHTINSQRYAMELQVMHLRGDACYENLEKAVENGAVLFISYFFQITPNDNPYIAAIVECLHKIEEPDQVEQIDGFPLSWLFHPFRKSFFYYEGSLTCPPCTEGVDWIIQPEPLSISSAQLKQFRRLEAMDGRMRRNTRPVQKVNNRKIFLYE